MTLRLTILAILFLKLSVNSEGQQAANQIDVTGVVRSFCKQEDSLYRFRMQLHVTNHSNETLIIPKGEAIATRYTVRYQFGSRSVTNETIVDWEYTNKLRDPKVVPLKPTSDLKVLQIGESLDLDLELRTGFDGGQESVSGSFQVVAYNWPGYSEQYSEKLEQAWQKYGRVWRSSFESKAIAFQVSRNENDPVCQ